MEQKEKAFVSYTKRRRPDQPTAVPLFLPPKRPLTASNNASLCNGRTRANLLTGYPAFSRLLRVESRRIAFPASHQPAGL